MLVALGGGWTPESWAFCPPSRRRHMPWLKAVMWAAPLGGRSWHRLCGPGLGPRASGLGRGQPSVLSHCTPSLALTGAENPLWGGHSLHLDRASARLGTCHRVTSIPPNGLGSGTRQTAGAAGRGETTVQSPKQPASPPPPPSPGPFCGDGPEAECGEPARATGPRRRGCQWSGVGAGTQGSLLTPAS